MLIVLGAYTAHTEVRQPLTNGRKTSLILMLPKVLRLQSYKIPLAPILKSQDQSCRSGTEPSTQENFFFFFLMLIFLQKSAKMK